MEANRVEFIYGSRNGIRETWNMTHVTIDPSVTVIKALAFFGYTNLIHVELVEGLETIELRAFQDCTSLENVFIPSTVKTIGSWAFRGCNNLNHVKLVEGLENIDDGAFQDCTSLENVFIPSTVNTIGYEAFSGCPKLIHVELVEGLKKICWWAFLGCTSLENVNIPQTVNSIGKYAFCRCPKLNHVELVEGLENIDEGAFKDCTSLVNITIPSTVKSIGADAFENCTSLVAINFCDKIEEFVSLMSLQDWWNHGRSKMSLETYNQLVRYNIPHRTGEIRMMRWKTNIHAMVKQIPSFASSSRNLVRHIGGIASQLTDYERLQTEIAPLLMLVIWKSKISEIGIGYACDSVNVDEMKLNSRYDSE
jgi:hypothetical protein